MSVYFASTYQKTEDFICNKELLCNFVFAQNKDYCISNLL